MKKLLCLFSCALIPMLCSAQDLQYQRKTVLWLQSTFWCGDAWTDFAQGAYDTIASIQSTNGMPFYMAQYDPSNSQTQQQLLSPLCWSNGIYIGTNCDPCYGNQPTFTMDNEGLGITGPQYDVRDNNGNLTFIKLADTLKANAVQHTNPAAVAAIGYNKVMVAPDSVMIQTRTKFTSNVTGFYYVSVFILEDSAMGPQAQIIGNTDTVPHRYMIRGNVQSGVFGWTLNSGNPISAGQEFLLDFSTKLSPAWDVNKLSYLMVLYHTDPVGGKYLVENATKGVSAAGIKNVSADKNTLEVYPQPASNMINIKIQQTMTDATINLYDITGKNMGTIFRGNIDVNKQTALPLPQHMAPGHYLLDVKSRQEQLTRSIIVK